MCAQCSHSFTPQYPDFPDYEHKGDDDNNRDRWLLGEDVPGVENGTWSCPHDAVDGFNKCPFHLPVSDRPPELDVTAAFLQHIEEAQNLETRRDRRRNVQFIDAKFESFDIAGEVIDTGSGHFINLSHSTIKNANFKRTRVRQPIRFAHATFQEPTNFQSAIFDGYVGMKNAKFLKPARFKGAIFNKPFAIRHSTFVKDAFFWHTVFKEYATFRDVDFEGYAYFRGVDFEKYVRFSQAHFYDEAWFKLGEFGDDADFIDTRFDSSHSFINAEFKRTTNFSGVRSSGPMDLSGAKLESLEMTPDKIESATQYVDLSESSINEGELGQPDEGEILYDVERATLGNIAVTSSDDTSVADNIRIVATNFDGFEFESDDMDPEVVGWKIHTVFDESLLPEDRRGSLSPKKLRETYLKAKNGAKQVGNTTAAGHFYYKEMTYRRKHLANLTPSSAGTKFRNRFDWLRNAVLWVVTGYGEYPLRVIGSSIGIVLGFGGLYQIFAATEASISESLLFSAQSFITFIVGSPPQGTTTVVATLSLFQGFIGAFFIALFVYTFTRRLSR